MRSFLIAGLTAAAALTCTTESSAACVTRGTFQITSEGPWNLFTNVDKGRTCVGRFTAGGTVVFRRLDVVSLPRRGRLDLRQGGRFNYKPDDGYAGPDSFTLRVCGEDRGVRGCANLHYAVTVS